MTVQPLWHRIISIILLILKVKMTNACVNEGKLVKLRSVSNHHPSGVRCALQWKVSVNTAEYSMLSGYLFPELCVLQCVCCEPSDTVACYEADIYTQCVWSLLSRPAGNRSGWIKDAGPSLNVSAFFGVGTHLLIYGSAQRKCEAKAAQSPSVSLRLLPATAESHSERLNEWLKIIRFLHPPIPNGR